MQHPYQFTELHPVHVSAIRNNNFDDIHAVYNLPAPRQWEIRKIISEDVVTSTIQQVGRVRVCISADFEEVNVVRHWETYAVVVPITNDGKEHPFSAVHLFGVTSLIGVLYRLGFKPAMFLN